jgi:hypothetical protein
MTMLPGKILPRVSLAVKPVQRASLTVSRFSLP